LSFASGASNPEFISGRVSPPAPNAP